MKVWVITRNRDGVVYDNWAYLVEQEAIAAYRADHLEPDHWSIVGGELTVQGPISIETGWTDTEVDSIRKVEVPQYLYAEMGPFDVPMTKETRSFYPYLQGEERRRYDEILRGIELDRGEHQSGWPPIETANAPDEASYVGPVFGEGPAARQYDLYRVTIREPIYQFYVVPRKDGGG